METQWKAIPGFPNYEVSDEGSVRSIGFIDERGGWQKPILRKLQKTAAGRLQVGLTNGGKIHTRLVHRLVLEAFVGPCPKGREACHWDDNPENNRLSNLRWGSPSENREDLIRNGKNHNSNKVTCPRGHLLKHPNLVPSRWKKGQRSCLACQRVLTSRRPGFDIAKANQNYEKIMKGVIHVGNPE